MVESFKDIVLPVVTIFRRQLFQLNAKIDLRLWCKAFKLFGISSLLSHVIHLLLSQTLHTKCALLPSCWYHGLLSP